MKNPFIESSTSRHTLFQQVLPLDFLTRALRVHPGEWKLLAWVTAIQLVMSASSIMINNVAQTTFLKRFGVQALPAVFLGEALITFFVAGLVSMLMERYRSLRVFSGLLIFYGVSAGLLRTLLGADSRWVYPVLYILKTQAVSILPILFWDILGDLFTTQQSKRLYTLVTAGGVVGTAAGSLLTRSVAGWIGTENILLLFTAGMGLAALLNTLMDRVAGTPVQPHSPVASAKESGTYGRMVRDFIACTKQYALLRYMIILLAIPNMLLPIMDYQFNVLVDRHFVSEATTLHFFGIYRGVSNTVIFLCLLVSSRLISAWGIPTSMLFHPANYVLAFTGILLRFDILAGVYAKFTTEVLKTVLNNPARSVLYNFFPAQFRSMVRVMLRGGVIRLSDFAGSSLLILVSGTISPRLLSIIAIPLGIVWVATSFRLRRAYPAILVQSLSEQQIDLEPMDNDQLQMLAGSRNSLDTVRQGLSSGDGRMVLNCAQLLFRIRPPGWIDQVLDAIPLQDAPVQRQLLSLLHPDDVRGHLPDMVARLSTVPPDRQWVWLEAMARLDPAGSGPFLASHAAHGDPRARIEAHAAMGRSTDPGQRQVYRNYVRELLKGDPRQVRTAVALAGKAGDGDFEKLLVDTLSRSGDPEIVGWALEGLARMGHGNLPDLALALTGHESGRVRLKALDTLCALADRVPLKRVVAMLRDPDQAIRERAGAFIKERGAGAADELLLALAEPSRRQRSEIARLLQHIGLPGVALSGFVTAELKQAYRFLDLARALAAAPGGPAKDLLQAILVEKQADTVDKILHALGTVVFGERMRVIVRALNSINKREREDAVEALDNALHGDIRRGLMPLLDGRFVQEQLITGRVTVKSWTRPPGSPGEAMVSLLSEPDPVLQALCLEAAQENPAIMPILDSSPDPLSDVSREPEGTQDDSLSLGQRIRHLRAMPLFQGIKIHELAEVVGKAQWITVEQGDFLLREGSVGDRIYLVCQGSLCSDGCRRSGEWSTGDIVGELACMDSAAQLVTVRCETKARLAAIACDTFQQILLQFPVLALNLCASYSQWLKVYHQRLECMNEKSDPVEA
ncbi:MAG: cyclic nucleotide-binding domain-containing protein [Deltaproteobacteria bacterium]|nr:cyclic nucleotide-binding domain-containing protein [Deltaproteobacteria bacterium]